MAEDSGYYENPYEGQTISPTQPTWKDRIAQFLMGDQRPSVERRNFVEGLMGTSGIGPSGFGIASLTPAGPILDAQEAAQGGDYRGAALAAIPIPGAARGLRVYHGSPYDFERFSLSKVNTGEGAQAYGHGLYFAEAEKTAKTYRDDITKELALKEAQQSGQISNPAWKAATIVNQYGGEKEAIDALQKAVDRGYTHNQEFIDAIKAGAHKEIKIPKGSMYEVGLRAKEDDFLDWDKPLSQQPQVTEKLVEAGVLKPDGSLTFMYNETPKRGGELYERLTSPLAQKLTGSEGQAAASEFLREKGIPGLRYLDRGSRAAGEGTRNYVVFDDSMIEILRKYGLVPGGLAGAGVAASGSEAEAAPQGYNQGGLVSSMPMTQYLNALGTIESGNNYSALGPRTEKGNQAYGRYQVMDFNIPVWTKEVLGQEMTPDQFLRSREAQDAVAAAKFGQYVEKTGNPYDAASMWFSGRPMDRAGNASDVTGTSVPEYVGRFANALGMPMEQDAEGIAALNAEELALARERMNLDQGPSNRQRQRMISAITDYYQSTLPKQADFSLLRRRG